MVVGRLGTTRQQDRAIKRRLAMQAVNLGTPMTMPRKQRRALAKSIPKLSKGK